MIVFYKTLQIHCSTTKTITGLSKIKLCRVKIGSIDYLVQIVKMGSGVPTIDKKNKYLSNR